jgi:hypothetical protein
MKQMLASGLITMGIFAATDVVAQDDQPKHLGL